MRRAVMSSAKTPSAGFGKSRIGYVVVVGGFKGES